MGKFARTKGPAELARKGKPASIPERRQQGPVNIELLPGSDQQEAFWKALLGTESHLILRARAGTGKTWSCLQGIARLREKDRGLRIGFVAFNKSIGDELKAKVPPGVSAGTTHGMLGYSAILKRWKGQSPNQWKTRDILRYECYLDPREANSKAERHRLSVVASSVCKLVSICKNSLLHEPTEEVLQRAIAYYDVDCEGNDAEVIENVQVVMEHSENVDQYGIDFDDMLWLPPRLGLEVTQYDVLFVDESQDLNPAQQWLITAAVKDGGRLVLVGDDRQAIYAFRGADSASISNMFKLLSKTGRGCVELPLTVTRRCPKVITQLAARLVPDFECLEDAKEGSIEHVKADAVVDVLMPNDLVLCRRNQELFEVAFSLMKRRQPVKIQGRDFGKGVVNFIKMLAKDNDSCPMPVVLLNLEDYAHRERMRIEKAKNPEPRLQALNDKCLCIELLGSECDLAGDLIQVIERLFADAKKVGSFVLLSSVHRAKGLEAERVIVLSPSLMPHPTAKSKWAREQEYNIAYVAVTRSLDKLIFVGDELPPAFA